MLKTADLLVWVVKGQSQHHISHLQLQLVTVGGSVIMYRFDLEEKEAFKPVDRSAFHMYMDQEKAVQPCKGILEGVHHQSHWSLHSVTTNTEGCGVFIRFETST